MILLTHATIDHIGAYAHCCKHIPGFTRIPVYATNPVISFGCTLLQDIYASNPLASSVIPSSTLSDLPVSPAQFQVGNDASILLPPPSNEEIAEYFNRIHPLKYSQPSQPQSSPSSPSLDGVTITAFPAGHTVGGTIWHIQRGSESVIYAVDWNQARENLLTGAAWLGGGTNTGAEVIEQLRQPTALVCSSKGAESVSIEGGWKNRDHVLLNHIHTSVSEGGSVLIPCDNDARVLELAFILERAWTDPANASLQRASVFMASHTSGVTVKYAQSMLEWMDDSMVREYEAKAVAHAQRNRRAEPGDGDSQPFDFKHVRLLKRKNQIKRALAGSGPKVFLASDGLIGSGFSREILQELSGDGKNCVIFVDRPASQTEYFRAPIYVPARRMLDSIATKTFDYGAMQDIDEAVTLMSMETSALSMQEKVIYEAYLVKQRQNSAAVGTALDEDLDSAAGEVDDASSSASSSNDSDSGQQGRLLTSVPALNQPKQRQKQDMTDEELGVDVLLHRKNIYDFDVRHRKGRDQIFPFVAKRVRNDDYGDLIRAEDYLRPEERQIPQDSNAQNGTKLSDKVTNASGKPSSGSANGGGVDALNQRRENKNHPGRHSMSDDVDGLDLDSENDSGEDEHRSVEGAYSLEPQKINFVQSGTQLKLKTGFVDFSAIHDKRSLQLLLPLIKPRRLILTGGSARETTTLASECRNFLGAAYEAEGDTSGRRIFMPENGSTVNASVDTNAWSSKINDLLLTNLKWHDLRDYGIATALGQVQAPEYEDNNHEEGTSKRQKVQDLNQSRRDAKVIDANEKPSPVFTALPSHLGTMASNLVEALQIGDTRLAQLRRLLQSDGHTAEFKGEGTLLIDGSVAVRKSATGQIEVELGGGSVTSNAATGVDSSFNNVKKMIYEGLAVVTTG